MTINPKTIQNLAATIKDAAVTGNAETMVSGITHDSQEIQSGDLFVCLTGANFDGHTFAAEALTKGAAAIVAQAGGLEKAGVTLPETATVLTVPDTRRALPLLACAVYNNPSHAMTMVGVTGTNGKTTVTRTIAAILRASGLSVGTIGTLGAELDGKKIPSDHTTPEADHLQKLLAEMRDGGAKAVVMEVSSHALAQFRTDGIAFNSGVFTNLTQDHLDFHGDMEHYYEAKARLFSEYPILYPRPEGKLFTSVINTGQWEGRDLITRARGDVITYATGNDPAVLKADKVDTRADCSSFTVIYDDGVKRYEFRVELPIGGAFQVGNALAAIGSALRLDVSVERIIEGLHSLPPIPGRFESIPAGDNPFSVVVDYAHTPDGLENLLRSAIELKPTRIICVFGCGGDRDKTKRPLMGKLAGSLTQIAIVTSDNPRKEDPKAIIDEIVAGMDKAKDSEIKAEIHIEPDRRKAIGLAITLALPGDLILIAGKGHEDYQIVGDAVLPFDDRKVAGELLS